MAKVLPQLSSVPRKFLAMPALYTVHCVLWGFTGYTNNSDQSVQHFCIDKTKLIIQYELVHFYQFMFSWFHHHKSLFLFFSSCHFLHFAFLHPLPGIFFFFLVAVYWLSVLFCPAFPFWHIFTQNTFIRNNITLVS